MNVLDHGVVELEEMMGGDAAVVRAARMCYQSTGTPESDERLIHHLMRAGHNTVFEHAVFRWHVKCPLFVARQWLRHRMGVFSEKSLRYCAADREYYVPDLPDADVYVRACEAAFDVYESLGWKREEARLVLPLSIYTEFVWTVNCWSLVNWLEKRLDKAAQREHREYAEAVRGLWHEAMPITSAAWETR